MSTQEFLQEAQFLHNIFVMGITLGIGVLLMIAVSYITRRRD